MKKYLSLLLLLVSISALWASNVITYTATEKLPETTDQKTSGLHTNAFNVAITSHEFADSIGTITFAGEVITIGDSAFYSCTSLSSITIPNSVTSIGYWAFRFCSSLTSVTIPNSVTNIGDYAFSRCSSLDSITLPNSVTSIGDYAFSTCYALTSITIPNSVIRIGEGAFSTCYALTSITIPDSVTSIGNDAFAGCTALSSIDVDVANIHYASIDGVLFNHSKDTLILYPIGNPRSEYTIPNNTTNIGDIAFYGCTSLKSITIPNSVTHIGRQTFEGCTSLISIAIPNSVKIIEWRAFYYCISLSSIIIPNSVTDIGGGAFYSCTNLSSITCYATTPPVCEGWSFEEVDKSIPVYVPSGSIDAYKSADEWKDFTNLQAISAEPTIAPDSVITEPTENSITITWPTTDSTYTYDLVIRDEQGNEVCTITFDANGTMTGITYPAPGRYGNAAVAAEEVSIGYRFTITGLDPGTNYTYAVIYKNEQGIATHAESGTFTTKGSSTEVGEVQNAECRMQNACKFIRNGRVLIQKDGKVYSASGAEVR